MAMLSLTPEGRLSTPRAVRKRLDLPRPVEPYNARAPLIIAPPSTYATFLGARAKDQGLAIAVDASDNAYVTGGAKVTDIPTASPLNNEHTADEGLFVTKLDASGTLVYRTYLGGAQQDEGRGIAIDGSVNAYGGDTNSAAGHACGCRPARHKT
jgi:hypothetical protein